MAIYVVRHGETPGNVNRVLQTPETPLSERGLVQAERVTHFNGAPTVLLMIAEAPEAQGLRFDPQVRVATGGSPPSPTLLAKVSQLGIRVTHLYGLTETYGPHVYCEMQQEWEGLDIEGKARVMARQGVPIGVYYDWLKNIRVELETSAAQ